jgi:hypothetical protein
MLLFCESPCSEIGDPLEFDGGEEGIFFFTGRRKRQKTNYICSLHATAVGMSVEVGRGARGHGNKFSGAKRGYFHVVAVSVRDSYLWTTTDKNKVLLGLMGVTVVNNGTSLRSTPVLLMTENNWECKIPVNGF